MSTPRERISKNASHRGSGGSEASVRDNIPEWIELLSLEPSALPSEWLDSKGNLDVEQAVSIYGSYICAKYDMPVSELMVFANVIKQKRDEVDETIAISETADEFKTSLVALEASRLAGIGEVKHKERITGKFAKKLADTSLKNLQGITPGLVVGPDSLYVVEQIKAQAESILAYNKKKEPAVA